MSQEQRPPYLSLTKKQQKKRREGIALNLQKLYRNVFEIGMDKKEIRTIMEEHLNITKRILPTDMDNFTPFAFIQFLPDQQKTNINEQIKKDTTKIDRIANFNTPVQQTEAYANATTSDNDAETNVEVETNRNEIDDQPSDNDAELLNEVVVVDNFDIIEISTDEFFTPLPPITENIYNVARIVAKKRNNLSGNLMYKIEWRGYNMYQWLEDFDTDDRCDILKDRFEKRARFLRRYNRVFVAVKEQLKNGLKPDLTIFDLDILEDQ